MLGAILANGEITGAQKKTGDSEILFAWFVLGRTGAQEQLLALRLDAGSLAVLREPDCAMAHIRPPAYKALSTPSHPISSSGPPELCFLPELSYFELSPLHFYEEMVTSSLTF